MKRQNVPFSFIHRVTAIISIVIMCSINTGCVIASRQIVSPNESPQCGTTSDGRSETNFFKTSTLVDGELLTFNRSIRKPSGRNGDISIETNIARGKNAIFTINARQSSSQNSSITDVLVRFGNAFSGVREMKFTTNDGHRLQGEIDGKKVAPFEAGASADSLHYADGSPLPSIAVDTKLDKPLRDLTVQAQKEASRCLSKAQTEGGITHLLDAPNGNLGRSDYTTGTASCRDCEGACVTAGVLGGIGAGLSCAVTFGLGCAVAIAGDLVVEVSCMKACHFIGAPCCEVACGDVACCFRNDSCLDQNRGVCCAPGFTACGGRQCCQTGDRCLADGTCCPPDHVTSEGLCCPTPSPGVSPISCRGTCCGAGEVCKDGFACCAAGSPLCNGVCCPGGSCDRNGNCCQQPNHLCDGSGVCCAPFAKCCGGECCSGSDDVCVNGACCPMNRACGSSCCPIGNECQNGRCVPQTCGQGMELCGSTLPDGKFGYVCCKAGGSCCGGVCCQIKDVGGCAGTVCLPIH